MKPRGSLRLIAFLLAAVFLLLQTIGARGIHAEQCTPLGQTGPEWYWGANNGIAWGPGGNFLSELNFLVPTSLLRPWIAGEVALNISVTSLNGALHDHGSQVVPLSATTVFAIEGDLAQVLVSWTTDTVPPTTTDIYTVDSQLIHLPSSTPLGPPRSVDWGPI